MKNLTLIRNAFKLFTSCSFLVIFLLVLHVNSACANDSQFEKFTSFTVEGINLSLTLEQAESTLKQNGYQKINSNIWRLKKGKKTVGEVKLSAHEGVLTRVSVIQNAQDKETFDFRKDAHDIKSKFAGTSGGASITGRNAYGDFFIGLRRAGAPYIVSFDLRPRKRIYRMQVSPYDLETYTQKQAQREASGLFHCLEADPTSLEDVLKCMGGMRYDNGASKFGRNLQSKSCYPIWATYRSGLTEAGVARSELQKHQPGCDIFAQAILEISGQLPYWASCVDYQGTTVEHAKQCLEGFIPRYYNKTKNKEQALSNAGDCKKLERDYRIGIKDASLTAAATKGYKPLPCEMANSLLAAWSPQAEKTLQACQGYSPESVVQHLEKCLALDKQQLASVNTCPQVRDLYEKKLFKTYGSLPANYSLLRCSDTKAILAKAEAVREEIIKKQREEMRLRAKRRAERMAASNAYWEKKFIQAREIIEGLDVKKGPVVPEKMITELEGYVSSSLVLNNIREYQQPGLLLALFAGEYERIQPRRGAALIYINAFHEAYANSEQPSCTLASSPQVKRVLQDAIMSQLGLDKFLSSNTTDSGMLGISVVLSMMVELKAKGGGAMLERQRNMEFLKEQAFYDALRMAQAPKCNQDTVKTLFSRAVEFVHMDSQ